MWGYTCVGATDGNTCRALNPNAGSGWSPIVITAATGSTLTIQLRNTLPAPVPTSLVIVGQLGGGLGTGATTAASPGHAAQGTTWPGTPGEVVGSACGGDTGVFCPPAQGPRVVSFATEVANGTGSSLTWTNLKAGTYLIESGTHPSIQGPMGLYGVLVVTDPGTAYPGVAYDADVPLLLSEIDAVQNQAVAAAVGTAGFVENAVIVMRNSVSSISVVDGGSGYSIGDAVTVTGGGGTGATAHVSAVDAGAITEVTIDDAGSGYSSVPAVTATTGGSGAQLEAALTLAGGRCSGGAAACYPPAVNYDPRYYLVNGVSFDRTNMGRSLFATNPDTDVTGTLLVRFVNAGLRMHIPSIVGAQTGDPAVSGFALIAEDGNVLPGVRRVQNQVFLAPGKTHDVLVNAPGNGAAALAVFDRQLSLSTNNQRDGGMYAYIGVNGAALPGAGTTVQAEGNAGETYYCVAGRTLSVTDPSKGVLANETGANGATLGTVTLTSGSLTFNSNGTFTYTQDPSDTDCGGTFGYLVNGTVAQTATIARCDAGSSSAPGCVLTDAPTANGDSFSSNIASRTQVSLPGVLANDTDPDRLPLTAVLSGTASGGTVTLNADGSFIAVPSCAPNCSAASTVTFSYNAVNSQNRASAAAALVTVNFAAPSGLAVTLRDGKTNVALEDQDYRWIIEEDRTVHVDPAIESGTGTEVRNLAINFYSSHMPVVAQGCTGPLSCESGQTLLGEPAVCDVGNGACRTDATEKTAVDPGQVYLDPTKHYYISVLPGDAANDVDAGDISHAMGGAQVAAANGTFAPLDVFVQPYNFPTAKISVFVFQDDKPLNGQDDTGGGVDVLAPNEAGLEGFNIVLMDKAGMLGDPAGQLTYDEFGMPVSNALAGEIDPATGYNACAISPTSADNIVGMIVTCPKYEYDGNTRTDVLSPLRGHAVIANMYPGLYEVHTTPGADRVAAGEEWLQTNTLDGTKDIEAFIKPDEPAYFQEFGPGGYHVAVGFANPQIIRDRKPSVCNPTSKCTGSFYGTVTALRMSRTPDQRVFSSGSYAPYSFGQCYVSLGAPDGDDFDFAKCDADGHFEFTNIPTGDYRVTVFDQWNDLLVDGLSTSIKTGATGPGSSAGNRMEIAVTQWRTNLAGRVFLDVGCGGDAEGVAGDGISQDCEPGLPLAPYNIRYRDGAYMGLNNTDLAGFAGFNEVFPLLNWLVVDIDNARHKISNVHVVYDAGGQVDATGKMAEVASSVESSTAHLPAALRVPGARYCNDSDCTDTSGTAPSSARIDPNWATSEAWQGLLGSNSAIDFALKPFMPNENGGIKGHVLYTPTRPFDDPALLLQLGWAPGIPNVKVNLYKEDIDSSGKKHLTLVDTTTSSSWDDYAQGFRKNADGTLFMGPDGRPVANMNCPGQETNSPFYFTMNNGTMPLDPASNPISSGGASTDPGGRFKCYDGWSMLNQVQPAPYDGMYKFPSIVGRDPVTGAPVGVGTGVSSTGGSRPGTNCTICTANPDPDDGSPMLPPGKYVVEVVVPEGFELVKEEDKNILLGDRYIAPVTQQFAGFGAIFIMPDQAAVNALSNPYNPLQPTVNNGAQPRREGDTGSVEVFWPCVGDLRIVPDLNSLFPGAGQQAPFAGATRPLCDRKEVTLEDRMTVLAKFYLFSSAHIAAHFTGIITNDFASEFDPFSPQFGEKFAVPNVPVAIRDFTGKEISRVYADQWGAYNGVTYSSWSVNPPSPSGYIPQMMIACMNDPGPITNPDDPTGPKITDPAYNPAYSNFCYEWPFMPGLTAHMDTPVLPTMAFAAGYNLPDCEYPDATPAIREVNSQTDGVGPWVAGANNSAPIASVTLGANGSGYTSLPTANFTGGGSGASASLTGRVSGVSVTGGGGNTRGSGYTSPATVSFSGGGGSGAAATAYMRVSSISLLGFANVIPVVSANGSYTNIATPAVTFSRPTDCPVTDNPPLCVGATGTAIMLPLLGNIASATRRVGAINVTNSGSGYTSPPTVSFSTGAPGAATATPTLSVNNVVVTVPGTDYTAAPAVAFTLPPPGGTRAVGSSTMSVDTILLVSGGGGYTSAAVTLSGGGGSGATATATLGALTAHTLTITSLGDKLVLNPAYSGPMSTANPFNKKRVPRHYNFGSGTGSVTIGGVPATLVGPWNADSITVNVPSGVPLCAVQQRDFPGARCGELEITAANGNKSVDTVTVTIGGKAPTRVTPESSVGVDHFGHIEPFPLQSAIDNASPGDLIIVGAGTYKENLLMWKPVRLQGVGAESVFINADAHPAGKMEAWRRQVNCLFGMALNGQPNTPENAFDATGTYSCPDAMRQHVDRIQFEAILGWDTTGNGNLAQLLQEPTLMGAYEGAGITVLGKGVTMPANTTPAEQFGAGVGGAFPVGYQYLTTTTGTNGNCALPAADTPAWREYYTTNYLCNPSRIDGLSVINSSQGGGAIFAHAWTHNLEISNTRVHGNHGTLTGGITIGNGEIPPGYIVGGAEPIPFAPQVPSDFPNGNPPDGTQLGFGFNRDVRVHHNSVTSNLSIGDALFSGTASAAGGVTFCSGADRYQFNYNWVCGNMSTGDGGGVTHVGFINNGTIAHNQIIFNQSMSPTIPVNGGGLAILGNAGDQVNTDPTSPDFGLECGTVTDLDCPPGLSAGTGRNLLIDANLIMGNSAESGTGGGLLLQQINGDDVAAFPTSPDLDSSGGGQSPGWNSVRITNNIIANNVAGWDGGGVSMRDALKVQFINNTVIANDTTASAGVLFNTLGVPFAATPPPGCVPTQSADASCDRSVTTTSTNQPAGLVVLPNTPNLIAAMPLDTGGTQVQCPSGYGYGNGGALNDGPCRGASLPLLRNNVFWQNRPFHVEVTNPTSGLEEQQKVVTVVPSLNQTYTGQIVTQGTWNGAPGSNASVNFWDIGVRGDTSPTPNSGSGFALSPTNSILTSGYAGNGNSNGNPGVVRQYSNGARIPPENCAGVAAIDQPNCKGYQAPAGRSEFTGLPVVFSLNQTVVAATVDEGNNWLSLSYGPLSLKDPVAGQATLGDYSITAGSPAINNGSSNSAPPADFFGRSRSISSSNPAPDIGAVEFVQAATGAASVSPNGVDFGNVLHGTTSAAQILTLHNNGNTGLTGIAVVVTAPFSRSGGSCGATLAAGTACTINLVFAAPSPSSPVPSSGTATITTAGPVVTGSPVPLTGISADTDVSITKSDGLETVFRSSTVTYRVVVTNNGPGNSVGAVVNDTMPAAFSSWSWVCAANPGTPSAACNGTTASTANPLARTLGTLAPGNSVTFTVTATVSATAAAGDLTNTATVTPAVGVADAIGNNNTATDTDTIVVSTVPGTIAFSSEPLGAANCTNVNCTTLDFGNENGNVFSTVRLTVGGGAGANVTFGNARVTNTGTNTNFSKGTDTCSGNSIPNGGSCTITINFFGPSTNNSTRNGTLTVPNSGANNPGTLALTGR